MKRGYNKYIAIFGLAAVLTGCTVKSSYDNNPISFSSLTYGETYSLVNSAEEFDRRSDLLFVDSVSMLIPSMIGSTDLTPLQDSIFKVAFDSTAVDHQSLIKDYFSEINKDLGFATEKSDEKINYYQADGYEVVKGTVTNLTPRLLVYCVINESMMPLAAHGMVLRTYLNYNIDNASIISLSNIFTKEGLEALPAIIARRANDRVAVFGPTEVESLPHNGNFFISPAGEIVFSYQPYEIASYAQGFINISFYPYELITYMTPYGVRLFGLNDLAN